MLPLTLFNESNSLSSNYLSLTIYSPYNFMRFNLFSSVSGDSFFKYMFRHYSYKLDYVTVKLTNVTLEHKSGVNLADESLVIINMVNPYEKSIS